MSNSQANSAPFPTSKFNNPWWADRITTSEFKGTKFYDIMPLLYNSDLLEAVLSGLNTTAIHVLTDFECGETGRIVSTEARGFLFGPCVAWALDWGFVPARKPGKLPGETISVTYGKEYGADTLEIQKNAIHPGDKIILVDDLIATGSTLKATADLVRDTGGKILGIITLIEFTQLGGRQLLEDAGYELHSLVKF